MIEWGLGIAEQNGVGIAEKPTGTGKSAVAAAVGSRHKTCVLVQKKALQDAYRELYGAELLKGKSNYPCIHPDKGSFDDTVDDCHTGDHRDCPYDCLYDLAKSTILRSMFSSANYAYWLSSSDFRKKMSPFLFMDEGHLLSNLTINHAGIKISETERLRWELPPFPLLKTGKGKGVFTANSDPYEPAVEWLKSCLPVLYSREIELKETQDKKGLKSCRLKLRKIRVAINAIQYSHQDWYIRSGFMVKGFVAKPLTAKYHFNGYFTKYARGGIIMSATIGDFDTLAKELGIKDFEGKRVPSMWLPESRPVYILDAPKLNKRSTEADYGRQAQVIADAIKSCPGSWSGIIHVTRKLETRMLAQRLAKNGLADRVWPAPEIVRGRYIGTGERAKLWNERRSRRPNSIAIAWDMWEGYDGLEERITIAAKTPFPSLGDEFERERMNYSGSLYLQRAAWALEQSLGRTRRGREEDYDTKDERRGMVAIADGNHVRVRKYLSEDFKEALIYDGP
jgi:Rad3-related DNA helicase